MIMWWVYLLVFFGGVLLGAMLMALMAAQKAPEQHIVHVFVDDDGIKTIKAHEGDMILFHKQEGGQDERTVSD